ncbi:MAG: hypothetical protein P4L40_24545 [Terracidiphilus sp.]|nr:hypothetical protein [Terracidiphilus sp.]
MCAGGDEEVVPLDRVQVLQPKQLPIGDSDGVAEKVSGIEAIQRILGQHWGLQDQVVRVHSCVCSCVYVYVCV